MTFSLFHFFFFILCRCIVEESHANNVDDALSSIVKKKEPFLFLKINLNEKHDNDETKRKSSKIMTTLGTLEAGHR